MIKEMLEIYGVLKILLKKNVSCWFIALISDAILFLVLTYHAEFKVFLRYLEKYCFTDYANGKYETHWRKVTSSRLHKLQSIYSICFKAHSFNYCEEQYRLEVKCDSGHTRS